MILDVPYKFLDIEPESELLNFDWSSISMERWARFTLLRENAFMFAETFTIPLMGPNRSGVLFDVNNIVDVNSDLPIHALVKKEVKKLEEFYNAKALIATLDGMPPGAVIARHADLEKRLIDYSKAYRCHLPLVTSWEVEFYIDDVANHFPAGRYFEFDNQRFHEVRNNSSIFRIHLVVDLLPNTEPTN
jgi:hypothetical protein